MAHGGRAILPRVFGASSGLDHAARTPLCVDARIFRCTSLSQHSEHAQADPPGRQTRCPWHSARRYRSVSLRGVKRSPSFRVEDPGCQHGALRQFLVQVAGFLAVDHAFPRVA